MNHLKRFNENLDDVNLSEDFDLAMDLFVEMIDKYDDEILISFETADGSRKFMSMDNYLERDSVYDKFIIALTGMTVYFKSMIIIKDYDYDFYINILNHLNNLYSRMKVVGWDIQKFESRGNAIPVLQMDGSTFSFTVESEFKHSALHNKKNTFSRETNRVYMRAAIGPPQPIHHTND